MLIGLKKIFDGKEVNTVPWTHFLEDLNVHKVKKELLYWERITKN